MNVSFANGVLTVVTDVTKTTIKKGISNLELRDDKKNLLYKVKMSDDGKASVDNFSITCNTYIGEKAAAVMVLGPNVTREQVEKQYGEALLAATQYVGQIAAAAAEKEDTISGLFDNAEDAE
jgi:hypothetical protein